MIGLGRRELLTRLGAGLLGVGMAETLAACSALSQSNESAVSTPAAATSVASGRPTPAPVTEVATPRRGGTLRFGNFGDFASGGGGAPLEPQTLIQNGLDNLFSVWDRLVSFDDRMQPQPMLAESWDIAENFQKITFHLRKGVQFHTGRELTADDVKWALQRVQDPKVLSNYTQELAPMTGVETPDSSTVVVRASRPWLEAFDLFQYLNIPDPVTFAAEGRNKPTGTGPFMFAEYAQGDHLHLIRNPNYWRSGLPYLDDVIVSIHSDASAVVVGFEAGALDVISAGLPPNDFVRLSQNPNYQTLLNPLPGTSWAIWPNCTRAPTNNKLFRQALNYALDRQRMADAVWHGLLAPHVLPWVATSPAYDAEKNRAYPFDLDKAKALLAQAGVAPTHLDVLYVSPAPPEWATILQIYQADLAKIGIDLGLKPLEAAAVNAARNAYDFDLVLTTPGGEQFTPQTNLLGYGYSPVRNSSGFSDDAYTRLVNQILSETDPGKLNALYGEFNNYFLDQSFKLYIVPVPEHLAAQKKVHGLRFDPLPMLVMAEVWMA